MAEYDYDDLDALRRIDPVDKAALPSAQMPKARALFERITMSQTETHPGETTEELQSAPPPRRGRAVLVAVAAAVVLVLGVAGVVSMTGGEDDNNDLDTGTQLADDEPGEAPISPGGGMALCVEMYDLDTLSNRQHAFDGTVKAVDGDKVTFIVNEAYRGVDGAEVTLEGAGTIGGVTSVGGDVATSLEPGTRLLVAGDDGFAWACGFTQPYDPAVAAEWKNALS